MQIRTLLPAVAVLLALAACDRSAPAPEPDNIAEPYVEPANEPEPAPLPPESTPAPANMAEPLAEAPPPIEATPPDEQMREDAEATGMTARVRRDEDAPADEPVIDNGQ